MGKTITLRVDDAVYTTLKRAADGDRRTISNFIENAAINYIFNTTAVDDNEVNELAVFEKDIKTNQGGGSLPLRSSPAGFRYPLNGGSAPVTPPPGGQGPPGPPEVLEQARINIK